MTETVNGEKADDCWIFTFVPKLDECLADDCVERERCEVGNIPRRGWEQLIEFYRTVDRRIS